MASTLMAHDVELAPTAPMLFDTMHAIVACRRDLRPVPDELVEQLRARRLATLVDAIERYNERMGPVTLSA